MCVANEPARFRRNQEIQLEKLGFFKPYAVITQGKKAQWLRPTQKLRAI